MDFWKKKVQPVAPKPTPKPVVKTPPFLYGVNVGLGLPIDLGYEATGAGLDFQVGFDFAYPLTDNFAIGCYASIGGGFTAGSDWYGSYSGGMFKLSVGLLMEIGDLLDRPFIIGVSPCVGFGFSPVISYVPLELRFGRFLSDNWYLTGEVVLGIGGFSFEPAIRIGYNFGN